MRVAREAFSGEREWPALSYVLLQLAHWGVHDPEECLSSVHRDYAEVYDAQGGERRFRLTVGGLRLIDPRAAELPRFVGLVRRCVDAYLYQPPLAPGGSEPLVVSATDLVWPSASIARDVRVMGLLLEGEGLVPVRWDENSPFAWSAELGIGICSLRFIGDLPGYLEARYGWRFEPDGS
jgi:hypothetical protein